MSTIIRKNKIPTIDEETKIPSFVVIYGSSDILIWIKAKVEKKILLPIKSNNTSRILNF